MLFVIHRRLFWVGFGLWLGIALSILLQSSDPPLGPGKGEMEPAPSSSETADATPVVEPSFLCPEGEKTAHLRDFYLPSVLHCDDASLSSAFVGFADVQLRAQCERLGVRVSELETVHLASCRSEGPMRPHYGTTSRSPRGVWVDATVCCPAP